jgi:hypothetical protein
MPAMMRSSVVLPQPDGPSRRPARRSGMSRLMLSSATKLPKRFDADVADFDAHAVFSPAKFSVQHVGFGLHAPFDDGLGTSVTSASSASTEAAAKAPTALYSL